MSKKAIRVLLVDDDVEILRTVADTAPAGFRIHVCGSGQEAVHLLSQPREDPIGYALISLEVEGSSVSYGDCQGVALAHWIREQCRRLPILLVTNGPHFRDSTLSEDLGALGVLTKPLPLDRLYAFLSAHSNLFPTPGG